MNESISRAAGTQHGQEFPPHDMETLIRSICREPMQRDTLYRAVPEERRAASMIAAELAPIVQTPPRKKAAVG
jgi:FO synthase